MRVNVYESHNNEQNITKLCTEHIMTIKSLFMTTHLSLRTFVYPEMCRIVAYFQILFMDDHGRRWRWSAVGERMSVEILFEFSRSGIFPTIFGSQMRPRKNIAFHQPQEKSIYGKGKKDDGMRF